MNSRTDKAAVTVRVIIAFLESKVHKVCMNSSSDKYHEWIFLSEILVDSQNNCGLISRSLLLWCLRTSYFFCPQKSSLIFFMGEHLSLFRVQIQSYFLRVFLNTLSKVPHLSHLQGFLNKLFVFFLVFFTSEIKSLIYESLHWEEAPWRQDCSLIYSLS